MTAIEKDLIRDALKTGLAAVLVAGWTRHQEEEAEEMRLALAALDAEKPAEDAYELALRLQATIYKPEFNAGKIADILDSFAKSYHKERCAACKCGVQR